MNNIASPNITEHFLLNFYAVERLQDLVDQEVTENGAVDLWPEHWEEAGAIEVWKCPVCGRLYFNPQGKAEEIIIYKVEKIGLDQ